VTDGEFTPFTAVSGALLAAGATVDAPEAHGSLCAMTCLLGAAAEDPWLVETLGADRVPAGTPADVLRELARATAAALAAGDMSFIPLLPGDDLPLDVRAQGLAEWCHGFAHGLVAAGFGADGAARVSPVAREVLDDLSALAQADAGPGEDEAGEAAWAELVEFLRVGVQLVFDELSPGRHDLAPPVLH
jgi:uncharacterized protein YgfB (UPF0149 family)